MKRICAALAGLLLLCMTGCTNKAQVNRPEPAGNVTAAPTAPSAATPETAPRETVMPEQSGSPLVGKLMCWADDEAAAKEIAGLYGIAFVAYAEHIATFDTEEDVNAVIARGRQNGWPALSINGETTAF